MKLLDEGQQNDQPVTWEDQENINKFSKHNIKLDALEDKFKKYATEKEYLDDLKMELELADEDELIKYRIGDCFISLPAEECNNRIDQQHERLNETIERTEGQINGIKKEMAKLKALLYAKFGNNINLEKD
ncbi:Prefoldin subunit 4 [Terramyces sp. JEL0728]|nr:Prefoldin subunit 4 [Terramyces sp. JEL0728]